MNEQLPVETMFPVDVMSVTASIAPLRLIPVDVVSRRYQNHRHHDIVWCL